METSLRSSSAAPVELHLGSSNAPRAIMRPVGRPITFVIVALGVALRLWQYAANTPLWMDEISLSRNIVGLTFSDLLLRPLFLDQVAPRGFLLLEKLVTLIFGPSELALRFVPLLGAIAGMILFWRLAERMLDGWGAPFAVFVYAIGIPLIRYAAEVKQYGIDAAVATGLVLLAIDLRDREPSNRRLVVAALVGFVVVWFSQSAVIVLAGLGLAFAIEWLLTRDRRARRVLVTVVPVWAVGCLLAVVAGLHSMTPSTKTFMDQFWAAGFLPWPMRGAGDLRWFWDRWVQVFADPFLMHYKWAAAFVVLVIPGLFALWRRRRDYALFLLGPLVIALLAAIAHQYPLHSRVAVYLIPGMIIAAAAGAEWLRRQAARVNPALGGAVMAACLIPPVATAVAWRPPYMMEDYRTPFAYLQAHRQPGDSVYAVGSAIAGLRFYGPQYGLQRADWRAGACDRYDTRPFLRDVDRYRGVPRVWVFATGLRPMAVARESIRSYLRTIGVRRDSLLVGSLVFMPIGVELYDLSDPVRLRAANAETFPVKPMPTNPRPGCRNWDAEVRPGPGPR